MKTYAEVKKFRPGSQSSHRKRCKISHFVFSCILSLSVLLSLPLCANDETSVQVSCIDSPSDVFVGEYTATFKAVPNKRAQSYNWSTTKGQIIGSRTESSIKLKVDVSDVFSPESGTVTCSCAFDEGKDESGSCHFTFPSSIPEVKLEIDGPSLIEWEDVEKGTDFSYNVKGFCELQSIPCRLSDVNWSISKGVAVGSILTTSVDMEKENGKAIVDFHAGGTCELTCTAKVGDAQISSTFTVQVMPRFVNFIVRRANYEVDNENKHFNFITGTGLRYVHLNLDDDNWSATDEPADPLRPTVKELGCDCEETFFSNDFIDDDLCEIEIKPPEDIEVSSGKLSISIPGNYRLWSSNKRCEGALLINSSDSTTHTWNLKDESDCKSLGWDSKTGMTLYIEGIKLTENGSCQNVIISYNGQNIGKYSYALCSSGTKEQQPTRKEREFYSYCFPGLVGCEWHVEKHFNPEEANKSLLLYNCIAHAVDPGAKSMGKFFWVQDALNRKDYPVSKRVTSRSIPTDCLYKTRKKYIYGRSHAEYDYTQFETSMDQFSSEKYCNREFIDDDSEKDDVNPFMKSRFWGSMSKLSNTSPVSKAQVIYYQLISYKDIKGITATDGYHAARKCELPRDSICLKEWDMFESKCGQTGIIVHRAQQVETQEHKICLCNEGKPIDTIAKRGYGKIGRKFK